MASRAQQPQTLSVSQVPALVGRQRVVVATAVQQQWLVASLGVSEALLKGLTFDEIQECRGGPKGRVSLIFPRPRTGEPSGVSILRTIKAMQTSTMQWKS